MGRVGGCPTSRSDVALLLTQNLGNPWQARLFQQRPHLPDLAGQPVRLCQNRLTHGFDTLGIFQPEVALRVSPSSASVWRGKSFALTVTMPSAWPAIAAAST